MMVSDLLGRLLHLSAFDGNSAAALRAMQGHLALEFPDCSVALLLVQNEPRGICRLAGLIGPDGTEHVANDDPFGTTHRLPRFADTIAFGVVAGIEAHALSVAPTERALPLAQALFAPATILSLPIVNAGQVTHWLALGSTLAGRFDAVDFERLLLEANLAASLLMRPLAPRALREATARQRQAIEGLADVQRMLLPDDPAISGLDFAVHWQPADTAAGDYYDLMAMSHVADPPLPPGCNDAWAVMLADVSGHGAAAAMEGVQFDAILRTYQGDEPPGGPAGAMTYANRHFFSRRQRSHFLTVFGALFDPVRRVLEYACAGHPPALLRRAGRVELLGDNDAAGIPLGILRDHHWTNTSIDVHADDLLVLYTDGIVDARDENEQPFGRERLIELVSTADGTSTAICDAIVARVHAHQGGPIGVDDQTLLVLRVQ